MKTIWKYTIPIEDEFKLKIPVGYEVLYIGSQGTEVCLWALVETDNEQIEQTFRVFGTGHTIKHEGKDLKYIGTAQLMHYVWHVFRVIGV